MKVSVRSRSSRVVLMPRGPFSAPAAERSHSAVKSSEAGTAQPVRRTTRSISG
ncbi:hypothetical protein GCM10009639_18230 [Kitasatospora putterlickiae]|uniref:Uncharacterized protein n=1 Tax=Kitasatospora putterlickiae TaxID=221725 RepID=A0ABN1XTQ3_9ACTN